MSRLFISERSRRHGGVIPWLALLIIVVVALVVGLALALP